MNSINMLKTKHKYNRNYFAKEHQKHVLQVCVCQSIAFLCASDSMPTTVEVPCINDIMCTY